MASATVKPSIVCIPWVGIDRPSVFFFFFAREISSARDSVGVIGTRWGQLPASIPPLQSFIFAFYPSASQIPRRLCRAATKSARQSAQDRIV